MIDWLTIVIALVIIASLVAFFGYFAWKINETDNLLFGGKTNENQVSLVDSQTEKKKNHDQNKKKRKEPKKPKREEVKQQTQSEETDEESEQDSSSTQQANVTDLSSKARKRQKNKPTVVVVEKTENPIDQQPKPLAKGKTQVKVNPTKPTVAVVTAAPKKAAPIVSREEHFDEEQPFTVVGANRNKTNSTTKSNIVNTSTTPIEPLAPRQPSPPTTQINGTSTPPTTTTTTTTPAPAPAPVTATKSTKVADLVKTLPSSKVVVSELMTALDAFALSSDELDLIAHKITNKQSILKQDWSKLTTKVEKTAQPSTTKDNDVEVRRLNELLKQKEKQIENLQITIQQRKQETTTNHVETNQVQQRLMQEQICKLSVQNGEFEKKIKRLETFVDEKEKLLKELENENEQLKRENIVHVEEPNGLTAEEAEKLQNEILHLKNVAEKLEKTHYQELVETLPENLRGELQMGDQWISSYRKLLQTHLDSTQRQFEEQMATSKRDNEKLQKNMTEVENQLKEIEQIVQTKEDLLILELKNKDEKIANVLHENETLTGELNRLRTELERVQTSYETSLSDIRALKVQLDERFLVAANTPPVATDESFELIKQSPPSSSPIVIDMRAEQLNELIRSSKEALENQDSLTQQLDRHLDDMHRTTGAGETSTSNVDESNATSSNQQ